MKRSLEIRWFLGGAILESIPVVKHEQESDLSDVWNLSRGSALFFATSEARQRLDALQTELERLTPSNAPSAVQDDPKVSGARRRK